MRFVRLKVQTNWEGKRLRYGNELYVPEAVAIRWERNNIADILDSEPLPPDLPPVVEPEPAGSEAEPVTEDGLPAPAKFTIERVGTSSWYNVLRNGEVVERVNGTAAAERRAEELSEEE